MLLLFLFSFVKQVRNFAQQQTIKYLSKLYCIGANLLPGTNKKRSFASSLLLALMDCVWYRVSQGSEGGYNNNNSSAITII